MHLRRCRATCESGRRLILSVFEGLRQAQEGALKKSAETTRLARSLKCVTGAWEPTGTCEASDMQWCVAFPFGAGPVAAPETGGNRDHGALRWVAGGSGGGR
ncbi:hypothetical protein CHELA1G11_12633 [Hyphomicrobiales bacterium]|nr:hypothetical protein CHELA1G2_11675 [Hyphomicrobiales bacterium]CAH1666049.1 hypothetical protein CHELA1G11_12633 [Hyphomicrobiales bacterium]